MLNTLQQLAYDTVIKDKAKIVLLLGAAGTGKSFTTAKIVKDYPGTVAVTATTNKAKEVLANMSKTKAFTTHSFSGYTMVRNGKSQFLSAVRESNNADLVIVEEVTMLPYNVWLTLYQELMDGNIKQLLLLGDPIQLPAIGVSIELNKLEATTIELTEQVRQASNPELTEYFTKFRSAIENKSYSFDPLAELPSCITIQEKFSLFAKDYKSKAGSKKVLAYSNSVIDKYNSHINGGGLFTGDVLVIDKPLGPLKNGDTITVWSVKDLNKYYLIVTYVDGERYELRHYKTKSALEIDLKACKTEQQYWNLYDISYNFKHQYACTIHKSQGSTYEHVFLDYTDVLSQLNKKPTIHNHYARPISYNTYLRLIYVALSRITTSATIYVGNSRTYKQLRS